MKFVISLLLSTLILVLSTQAYAGDYIVSDTSIPDHGDTNTVGSIANALQSCANDGGGHVNVKSGTYQLSSSLTLGKNCKISGSGFGGTVLHTQFAIPMIIVDSDVFTGKGYWSIEDIHLSKPDFTGGDFIYTTPVQASYGHINNVQISGGGNDSWAINIDAANHIKISNIIYTGHGNGVRFINSNNLGLNIGDSLVENVEIVLRSANTTGIQLYSPIPNTSGQNRINNIQINRTEVRTTDGIVRTGTIGVHLHNVARITLVNVDLEHMNTGILQESAVNGGAIATSNAFIQIYYLGCNNEYVEVGTPPKKQTILGGHGDSTTRQVFPSSTILADHPIMGSNPVFTAVRKIEAHTDSNTPRVLRIEDSGTIFTNKGATGPVVFELPAANFSYSIEYEFHSVTPGETIRIQPSAGDLIRPGQTSTGVIYESGTGWGQVLKIRNIDNTIWSIMDQNGNWSSMP